MIHRGELRPGDRLPPGHDLARLLGVSRSSLRAVNDLFVKGAKCETCNLFDMNSYVRPQQSARTPTEMTGCITSAAALCAPSADCPYTPGLPASGSHRLARPNSGQSQGLPKGGFQKLSFRAN